MAGISEMVSVGQEMISVVPTELVSVGQAAHDVGVSAEYLWRLIRCGELRGVSTVLGTLVEPVDVERLAVQRGDCGPHNPLLAA